MTKDSQVRPIIVVPVHLDRPSVAESISLRQLGKIFGDRDILVVAPQTLNLGAYRELLPRAENVCVEPEWMASIQAYNRMMISSRVVSELDGYTHMLLHEPDAIVLRDELNYWCEQAFDYIGAPWFDGYANALPNSPVVGVGNSGFSLHRLSAFRKLNKSRTRWYPYRHVAKDLIRGFQGDKTRLRTGLKAIGRAGQLRGAWDLYDGHCDAFWSHVVPGLDEGFRIAPVDKAVRFSWEVLPDRCMHMTGGKLPFGLHAWAKYDLNFLLPHLIGAGVDCTDLESC